MNRLTALFSLLLTFCLTACMSAGPMTVEKLHGLWQDESGRYFFLDADGSLGLPGSADMAGLRWNFDGSVLSFTTLNAPGNPVKEHRLIFQKRSFFGAEFLDENGKPVTWKKSFKKAEKLEGTLFYRERMMLPPEVTVCAELLPLHSDDIAARTIVPVNGQEGLKFRLYYLTSAVEDKARLTASVFFQKEPLFATPDREIVSLNTTPAVLLHHAVPSRDIPPLQGTHWRLKELNGAPAQHFDDQPEAHLLLQKNGQATGSDGCNNFFMGWQASEQSMTFTPGGATLRMCPHGSEQALSLYQMFSAVDAWKISGIELELYSGDKKTAVFEAVDM